MAGIITRMIMSSRHIVQGPTDDCTIMPPLGKDQITLVMDNVFDFPVLVRKEPKASSVKAVALQFHEGDHVVKFRIWQHYSTYWPLMWCRISESARQMRARGKRLQQAADAKARRQALASHEEPPSKKVKTEPVKVEDNSSDDMARDDASSSEFSYGEDQPGVFDDYDEEQPDENYRPPKQ